VLVQFVFAKLLCFACVDVISLFKGNFCLCLFIFFFQLSRCSQRQYATMSGDEMIALTKKHNFFSWSAQDAVAPIAMSKAKGVYFWDAYGKKYFDLNSQLMCSNIGHGNQRVIDAIKKQADELT
jgi:4-aminobutyrate aminotransferase-like enzyme